VVNWFEAGGAESLVKYLKELGNFLPMLRGKNITKKEAS
jgi:hypothetical protein